MWSSVKWRVPFGIVAVLVTMASFAVADTDPRDVFAVNSLFVSLGLPPFHGWMPVGGDPCGDQWQGVSCVFSNITSINLNGLNLGGTLGSDIGLLTSLIEFDVSDNHIGGSIPSNLPLTLRNLSFARNQFDGNIPDTLPALSQLLDLSFHNNLLSGGIPDVFQHMMGLINLDMSGNNISGQLPPSMGSLSSLNTLHLQNNELTGTLDVLQDLPLQYLNVENNLFSGPIPPKLLTIPNFRREGNPFNTTIILSPSSPPSLAPSSGMPPFAEVPETPAHGSSASDEKPNSRRTKPFFTTKKAVLIAALGVVIFIVVVACVFMSACCKRRQVKAYSERQSSGAVKGQTENLHGRTSFQKNSHEEKVPRESIIKMQDHREVHNNVLETGSAMASYSRHKADHAIDMSSIGMKYTSLQPPPVPHPCMVDKVGINPIASAKVRTRTNSAKSLNLSCSVRSFTIATLQEHTNSFSEANFIREGTLGSVYKAELPDTCVRLPCANSRSCGTYIRWLSSFINSGCILPLAVKKLNNIAAKQQTDEEFLELVSSISEIRHANIVGLVGYCNEHGQRLLVYEYCENGTLYDALHVDDEIHTRLSWNVRIQLALGAARALQYMHEVCQPPVVHGSFNSLNILLDDKLAARVSEYGLAPLKSLGIASEGSGHHRAASGCDAPEFELGCHTFNSDVYSFGVVMLELLTGRKPFDRSRGRGEQSLVRWAVPQLHDIDALCRMVDPALGGSYPTKSLSRFADIISRCVQWEPEFRPSISEVVQDLSQMIGAI